MLGARFIDISTDKGAKIETKIKTEACCVRRPGNRIQNLIDEVHKQLAVHLASYYDLMIIPKFQVSQLIRKVDRKMRSKTARQMATWAHYRLR